MHSRYLHAESPWNTELLLPLVSEDSAVLEIQILLGGLSLVLSRLHPEFARTNFLATRRVAMRLTRAVEYDDPAKAHFIAADLQESLNECQRALDPGTLMTLKSLLAKTQKSEAEAAKHERQDDFTMSDFLAEEQLKREPTSDLRHQRAIRV
jgi:hypothetical protein